MTRPSSGAPAQVGLRDGGEHVDHVPHGQLALWDDIRKPSRKDLKAVVAKVGMYPRLRYMGSKVRLIPQLVQAFSDIGGRTALDAFSGSGVVSYALKCLGYEVSANDFLAFPGVIASATVANQHFRMSARTCDLIRGPAADDRDFVQRTFDGIFFGQDDRIFLDSAWSHVDRLDGEARAIAIAALVLAAARKQPRGVFTFTNTASGTAPRYDDGRRDLHLPLRDHFVETVAAFNRTIFDSGRPCRALHSDVFDLQPDYDVVYLDPPYAPPRDDNCYIKRYHFLEGLSVYWREQIILEKTRTKKLQKRYTPFSYKHTVTDALHELFRRFGDSTIVLSYSSNAVPDAQTISGLLRKVKRRVEIQRIDHRYHFGTHASATRREATEYLFIGT